MNCCWREQIDALDTLTQKDIDIVYKHLKTQGPQARDGDGEEMQLDLEVAR